MRSLHPSSPADPDRFPSDADPELRQRRAFLRLHAPFDRMEEAAVDFLVPRLEACFYPEGHRLTAPEAGPAERFHIIRSGLVRGETPAEDEQVSGNAWELVEGECFPIGALLSHRPVRTVHRAAADTLCLEIDRDAFEELRAQSPVFNDFCIRRIANLLDRLQAPQPASPGAPAESDLTTTLARLLRRPAVSCAPETRLRGALQTMHDQQVGAMIVVDPDDRPLGLFTLRDLLQRTANDTADFNAPIRHVMTAPVDTLEDHATGLDALDRLAQHGYKHVVVTREQRLVGVLSEHELLQRQPITLDRLIRAIRDAKNNAALRECMSQRADIVRALQRQGGRADDALRLISRLHRHITQRVIALQAVQHELGGIEWAWLHFGSAARMESALITDQDNGIVFRTAPGARADDVRAQLLPFARSVNDALDDIGIERCPGNIMAGNPACCLSLEEWQTRFRRWIDQGTPEHLLAASIHFDVDFETERAGPFDTLKTTFLALARDNGRFRRQLAEVALSNRPPLGLFGGLKVEHDGLDIKKRGLTPIVDAARIVALESGIGAANTHERLEHAAEHGQLRARDARDFGAALHFLQGIRLERQLADLDIGRAPARYVDPSTLDSLQARLLKESFRQVRKFQEQLAVRYQL